MKNSKWFVFVIVLMVAMLIPAMGFCQKKIDLKYSLSLSTSHPFSQVLVRWFENLEKATNGRLKDQKRYASSDSLSEHHRKTLLESAGRGSVDLPVCQV